MIVSPKKAGHASRIAGARLALAAAALVAFPLSAGAQCPGLEEALHTIETAPAAAEAASARIEAARCYAESGRYLELWRVLGPAVESPDRGRTWDEAMQVFGQALLARGLYLRAAAAFAAGEEQASSAGAADQARAALERLVPALDPGERRYLLQIFPALSSLCETRADMAESALEEGDSEQALKLAREGSCGGLGRVSERIENARATASARLAASGGDDFFTIGVLAPLTGDLARYGAALSQGVWLALADHNGRSGVKLAMRLSDTASDPVRTAAAAESLADEGTGAVIGGILTSATLVAAAALRASETVLVSPSAIEDRIGLVGPSVFQTMVPRRLQGRAIAAYAVNERGWKRLAVLHAETDEGVALASAFADRARDLGAEVVYDESYRPRDAYFVPALSDLAAQTPEALFADGDAEDLAELVSQTARRGSDFALLGPETMGQPEVLAALADLPGEAAYAEDYYLLPEAEEKSFQAAYQARYGEAPDRFARSGYIAAVMLANAYDDGAYSRRSLRERLAAHLGADAYLRDRRILEPDPGTAEVAVYRVTRGEVVRAGP